MDWGTLREEPIAQVGKAFLYLCGGYLLLRQFYYALPIDYTIPSIVQMLKITMMATLLLLIAVVYLFLNPRKEKVEDKTEEEK